MRLYIVLLVHHVLPLIFGLTYGWEIDDRCPKPPTDRRRGLRYRSNDTEQFSKRALSPLTPLAPLESVHVTLIDNEEPATNGEEDANNISSPKSRQLQHSSLPTFHLKMYWEEGYCWQEEWRERKWCFDCQGTQCNEGDFIEIHICASTNLQEFAWIPEDGTPGKGRLQVADKDLCLERVSGLGFFQLQPCSRSGRQVLIGFTFDGPFELHPLGFEESCMSQHHDPKPHEEIYGVACLDARRDNTNRWEVWFPSDADEDLRDGLDKLIELDEACTETNPCERCFGDCDSDDECVGNLKCYQRSEENSLDEIPGCYSLGWYGSDYCYDPNYADPDLSPADPNDELITLSQDCSEESPCQQCYGDCDSDDECVGDLKCYQRRECNAFGPVPGCSGLGGEQYDYCYDASQDVPLLTESNELIYLCPDCSNDNPCPRCYGDCDNDDHCIGNLICFQRTQDNPLEEVPGCSGMGREQYDYCYDPDPSFTTITPSMRMFDSPSDSPSEMPREGASSMPSSLTAAVGPDVPFVTCLSGDNHLTIKRGDSSTETILIKNLKVGDHVQDGEDSFSEVYSFGHYSQGGEMNPYLQVHTKELQPPLELSTDHLVFSSSGTAIPAALLSVGDSLLLSDGDNTEIVEIRRVIRPGAFAPFTKSGRLLVNGVVVSSFVSMDRSASGVEVYGVEVFTYHWLACMSQAPHRVYHMLAGCAATSDSQYTDEGISYWVAYPLKAALWLVRQHELVRLGVLSILLVLLIPVAVLEHLLVHPWMIPAIWAAGYMLQSRRQKKGRV